MVIESRVAKNMDESQQQEIILAPRFVRIIAGIDFIIMFFLIMEVLIIKNNFNILNMLHTLCKIVDLFLHA